MPYIFPEFAPDRASYDPTVMSTMANAIPKATSYGPIPSFVPTISSLPEAPRGQYTVRRADESFVTFLGTATRLWRYNDATLGWDDVSGTSAPFSVPDADNWHFVQFGEDLIATQIGNPPQYINVNSGTVFADVPGDPPQAKYVGVIGPFLEFAHLGSQPLGVQWSGRNDKSVWVNGEKSSGGQEFQSGGEITGVVGGQNGGVLFFRDAIRLINFNPSSEYTLTHIKIDYARGRGCIAPDSICTVDDSIYFLDESGFFKMQGGSIIPIGDERVDRFLRQNASNPAYVQGTADVASKSVYFRYLSIGVTTFSDLFTTNKVLGYNWAVNKWFSADLDLTWLQSSTTNGTSLDGLDATGYNLDTLPYSLDSDVWKGGRPIIMGINQSFEGGYFSGPNMAATLETPDMELIPGRRTMVQGARIYADTTAGQLQIGSKETLGTNATWSAIRSQSKREGICRIRKSGRFLSFRAIMPEGADWGHVSALEYKSPTDAGA